MPERLSQEPSLVLLDEIPDSSILFEFGPKGHEGEIALSLDGYVGHLAEGGRGVLSIEVPDLFEGWEVDGTKNMIRKKNWNRVPGLIKRDGDRGRFQSAITLQRSAAGVLCTMFPKNNFRIVCIDELESGETTFYMWEIALISQGGPDKKNPPFFVTSTLLYQEDCYQHKGQLSCPRFESGLHEWPDLMRVLREQIRDVDVLPERDQFYVGNEFDYSTLAVGEGIVQFWSPASECGMIATREGMAKVHRTQVRRSYSESSEIPRLVYLRPNERVEYGELAPPEKGPTIFKMQARDVRVAA